MADVYICRGTETKADVVKLADATAAHSTQSNDQAVNIDQANPHLQNRTILRPYEPVLLAPSGADKQLAIDFQSFRNEFQTFSNYSKDLLSVLGPDDLAMLDALNQFLNHHIYNGPAGVGDSLGFGGASLGVIEGSAGALLKQMREIEDLLALYARAPAMRKHLLKPQIREAYKNLHRNFGGLLRTFLPHGKVGSGTPLASARRAMRMTHPRHGGRVAPLSRYNRNVMQIAHKANWFGKGFAYLDLGLRAHAVANSNDAWRELGIQSAGFLGGYYVGLIGTGIALTMSLGPIGWIIAIVLIATGAVLADYLFKGTAAVIIDHGRYYVGEMTN